MNPSLKFREGYEYQVFEDYKIQVLIRPETFIRSDFIRLDSDGLLYIFEGYAWDGPSGPAIDTKNFMIASLVHDALYQLMREKLLDPDVYREQADKELIRLAMLDGMSWLRAQWVYAGVRFGGGPAARDEVPILTAPR